MARFNWKIINARILCVLWSSENCGLGKLIKKKIGQCDLRKPKQLFKNGFWLIQYKPKIPILFLLKLHNASCITWRKFYFPFYFPKHFDYVIIRVGLTIQGVTHLDGLVVRHHFDPGSFMNRIISAWKFLMTHIIWSIVEAVIAVYPTWSFDETFL